MSFKCDFCKQMAPSGTPQHLVTTRKRLKPNGGEEIVTEKKMCDPCWARGESATN